MRDRAFWLVAFLAVTSVSFITMVSARSMADSLDLSLMGVEKQCKEENAECKINESGKECCVGLTCIPSNDQSGNGKCTYIPVPTPTKGDFGCTTDCYSEIYEFCNDELGLCLDGTVTYCNTKVDDHCEYVPNISCNLP